MLCPFDLDKVNRKNSFGACEHHVHQRLLFFGEWK